MPLDMEVSSAQATLC